MNEHNVVGLPADWALKELGDPNFAVTSTGGTPSRKQPTYFGGAIPWVKSGELNDSIIKSTEETLSVDGLNNSAAKVYQREAVLIALYGATVGRTAILGIDAAVNQAVCAIRPVANSFDPKFMMFALMHLRPVLLSRRHGGAQPNISQSILRALEVPVPSLDEQRRIASVLWTIQQAIAVETDLIRVSRELKAAVMSQLFTKGLRGEPQKETAIGMVPESWEIVPLGSICELKNGINFSREEKGHGILTVDVLNMYSDSIDVDLSNLYRVNKPFNDDYLLSKGDILIVRSSLKQEGVGWPALFSGCDEKVTFCGFIIRCRLNADVICPELLTHYLRLPHVRLAMIAGSGRVAITNVNQATISNVNIPIAPEDEQSEMLAVLKSIDDSLQVHRRKEACLKALFFTTLTKLMSAEIRVTDLDINLNSPTFQTQGAAAA